MAQAPASDQRQLLEVAQLDSRLARLERDNAHHPLREELSALLNASAAKDRERTQAEDEVKAAHRVLAEAENSSAALHEQIAGKDAQLASGEGMDSRMLLAMQEEIAGLRALLDEANEGEFAALEAVEEAEGRVASLESELAALKDRMLSAKAELEDAVAEIEAEKARISANRAALYEPLAPALREAYEAARTSGGYAVLAMHPGGQTDGGIELSPVEVDAIRKAPEDEICVSEDYSCIIVRV